MYFVTLPVDIALNCSKSWDKLIVIFEFDHFVFLLSRSLYFENFIQLHKELYTLSRRIIWLNKYITYTSCMFFTQVPAQNMLATVCVGMRWYFEKNSFKHTLTTCYHFNQEEISQLQQWWIRWQCTTWEVSLVVAFGNEHLIMLFLSDEWNSLVSFSSVLFCRTQLSH